MKRLVVAISCCLACACGDNEDGAPFSAADSGVAAEVRAGLDSDGGIDVGAEDATGRDGGEDALDGDTRRDDPDSDPDVDCEQGFERGLDGVCADIDECEGGTHDCSPQTECRNTDGGFECSACPDGFLDVNGDGTLCRVDERALCDEFRLAVADLTPGAWSGSTATCDAGDVGDDGRDSVIRLTNYYRSLAGLDPISRDRALEPLAQECALMMASNGRRLSHTPGTDWPCYTPDGAEAAGASNIATTDALEAIDLYFVETGNADTMGHRRWLLAPTLDRVGIGSTDAGSCMWVVHPFWEGTDVDWIAWPPPGPFPIEAGSWGRDDANTVGWTFSAFSFSLEGATVTVWDVDHGGERPVDVTLLPANYGDPGTLLISPRGWPLQGGAEYRVTIDAPEQTVEYTVYATSCR